MAIGSSEYAGSSIRCMRRSRRAAMKKIVASFASSEGWTPMLPMPNQRRALFTAGMNSTAISAAITTSSAVQINTGWRYVR